LQEAVYRAGVPAHINRVGSMLSVFFTECPVTDSETAFRTDRQMFSRVFHAMLRRGVFLPPSALEAWFVSMAHTETHVERTARAFAAALREAVPG
jgi:glutamate-1-semialdehyde 2,1-aminomutase